MTSTALTEGPAAHCCPTSPVKRFTPRKPILLPPYHTSFSQFTRLIPEIRAKIWTLLLPPPRVILVKEVTKLIKAGSAPSSTTPTRFGATLRSTSTQNPGFEKEYRASSISYGGRQPILLSICKESREEALKTLTERFKTYWDLKRDYLYIEAIVPDTVANMRKECYLEGFRNMAFDLEMGEKAGTEHIMTSLRLLYQVSNVVFLLQRRNYTTHYDIANPGVSWHLIERESPEQTEYQTHESWCRPMMQFRGAVVEFLKVDLVENEKGWIERGVGTGPEIEVMMLGGRKTYYCDMMATASASRLSRFTHPNGMDLFG